MCMYFDELANKALNCYYYQDLFERGFVVDNKSSIGLGVRDEGNSTLYESVDSKNMVRNLSTSQKYIKYTWFLTFTANQSGYLGLHFLHRWKTSKEWTKK